MPESPIRKLAEYGIKAQKKGIKIYHLNIGQPDLGPPPIVYDYLNKYDDKCIAYSHSKGEQEYLDALVKYYHDLGHTDLSSNNFIATLGGSEAILWSIMTVADPGDEILTFEPFYTNYHSYCTMADIKLVPIETKIETGFHLPSKEEIIKKISNKTKAILICNPNNPTGTIYNHKELTMVYDICKENNILLLSDEVYREFSYDGHEVISALTIEKELEPNTDDSRVIILDSFSKRFSLCGARIGFACSRNQKIMDVMLRYGQSRLAASSIIQQMTTEAINKNIDYIKKVVDKFSEQRQALINGLKKIDGVIFQEPEGAFYIIAKLPVDDAEKFSKWLLTDYNDKNETIMLAPANGFYLTEGLGKDEVRIAYVLKKDDLVRAMEILNLAISKWKTINH